jgi:pyruvate kinase
MKKISIFATIGPSTINHSDFLKFSNKNLSLLRLNMSHLNLSQLKKYIKQIRRFSKTPICIDTEGAQIRTKIKKKKINKKRS